MTPDEIKELLKLSQQCRVIPCDYLDKLKLSKGVVDLIHMYYRAVEERDQLASTFMDHVK